MKFLIFGIGMFYQKRKESLFFVINNKNCIGYVDNFKKGDFEGKPIYNPSELLSIEFDFVIIMSGYAKDMYEQLMGLDIPERKILLYDELLAKHESGKLQIFPSGNSHLGKRILIITHTLCYNGGAIAAIYAGMALQQKGYNVNIATSIIDRKLVEEANKKGLNVIYCKAIPFVFPAERRWIETFDIVLVNTFPMLPAAMDVSKFRPVLWWIHEPSMFYPAIANKYPNYLDKISAFNGVLLAVSAIAEKNFNDGTNLSISKRMFYGIPDTYVKPNMTYKKNNISFAIIGPVSDRKGQDIFAEAILQLPIDFIENNQFIVIGVDEDGKFSRLLHSKIDKLANIKFAGELSRVEMAEAFKRIDVVVCPSREDPLPIVVTEGLMNRKICIISDAVGQVNDIIKDGENGFICKAGDAASLAEKMKFVMSHINELGYMKERARKTYKKYFSMEAFGNKLEQELLNTERTFLEKNIS